MRQFRWRLMYALRYQRSMECGVFTAWEASGDAWRLYGQFTA